MKILKSVRHINFQSHKDTLIEFAGPGCLTVITGPSDNGKSAVIRALRWVFYNVPQGDGFIFNAEDKCTVTLEYDDGTTVKRIRSRGGINRYIVNGQTFEGFGTGVPIEVQQATGIRKLEIGDQGFFLNLSEQLDGPFLGKSVSGPARAKVLGKLAGTEEIDYAGKEIGTDLFRAKKQKEILERDIEGLEKQINRYGFIKDWERAWELADAILDYVRTIVAEIGKLKALAQQWNEYSEKVTALKKVVAGLQGVDKGLELVQTAQDELTKGNRLCALRSRHFEAVTESERSKAIIIRLDPVFRYAEPIIDEMAEKDLEVSKLADLCVRYDSLEFYVLALRKTTERLSGIHTAINHFYIATSFNFQLIELESIFDQYERSNLSVLTCRKMVENLSVIDDAGNYYSLAEHENNLMSTLEVLKEQHEQGSRSVLKQLGIKSGLREIDIADDYLQRASKDNLQLLKTREFLRQRAIYGYGINQTMQQLSKLVDEASGAEADYLAYMSGLGRCPTCGGDINIKNLQEVV